MMFNLFSKTLKFPGAIAGASGDVGAVETPQLKSLQMGGFQCVNF
jgi:hypothetical protein